jgi:hypothetical protein
MLLRVYASCVARYERERIGHEYVEHERKERLDMA